jgi:HSP20 family molecular chaperone IbpA
MKDDIWSNKVTYKHNPHLLERYVHGKWDERRYKMEVIKQETVSKFKVAILSPGASKSSVGVTIDHKEKVVHVQISPNNTLPKFILDRVEMEDSIKLELPKQFKSNVKIKIERGIILITAEPEDYIEVVEVE